MTKKPAAKKTITKPATAAKSVKPPIAAKTKSVPTSSRAVSPLPAKKLKEATVTLNGATHKPAAKSGKALEKKQPALTQKEKPKKPKLIRDSFTMPEAEYQVLGDVKKACIKAGFEVKKSELLRIGVALIHKMDAVQLKDALAALPPLKAGRPRNQH